LFLTWGGYFYNDVKIKGMDANVHKLILRSQTNLNRLKVRLVYITTTLANTPPDFHRQYGPYAEYWDEWYSETITMRNDLSSDIASTSQLIEQLHKFITSPEIDDVVIEEETTKKSENNFSLIALEALSCQQDMLKLADERIANHRELTKQLRLIEAIDSLSED